MKSYLENVRSLVIIVMLGYKQEYWKYNEYMKFKKLKNSSGSGQVFNFMWRMDGLLPLLTQRDQTLG